MRIRDAGDRALVVEFGDTIDPQLVARVRALDTRVRRAMAEPDSALAGVLETVPTFRSLTLVLDPLLTSPDEVADIIGTLLTDTEDDADTESRRWLLPVRYGGDHGPDLEDVAQRAGLDPDEVIARHTDRAVSVYLLGFMPGFAFMGNTDTPLHLPRRSEPRVRVPAGSVGLALTLTAIYPWESPGGWHLIGHSPVTLFDTEREPAALLAPGDTVQFRAVDADEHTHLLEQRERGALSPQDWLQSAPP